MRMQTLNISYLSGLVECSANSKYIYLKLPILDYCLIYLLFLIQFGFSDW